MSTRRNFKILLSALVLLLVTSCQTQLANQTDSTGDVSPSLMGADREEHNCTAAGYTWSVLKNNCVRLIVEGIRLAPTREGRTTTEFSAFVIFSEDKREAEVFLPELPTSLLLRKSGEKNPSYWEKEGLRLFQNEELVLMKGDRVIFAGK